MRKSLSVALLLLLIVALSTVSAVAQSQQPDFQVTRATKAPVIDGKLDDDAWKMQPLSLSDWLSYDPLYGRKQEQKTEVRVTYDDRYLYFSFHCLDAEPDKVRTTIARRDNVFADDWVGLSLDSGGSGQTSYHMMVNPSGIQMDALNTSASGQRWEADWIWDSAGTKTADGYSVEIRLPLQSIRFKGGDDVRMGILFWRRISRLGVSAAWPDIPPGQWVFNRHAHLMFHNLQPPTLLDVLPTTTYAINQTRSAAGTWNEATRNGDVGLSVKYGLTSSITLDATINPDFSQVESDAFQVQVNQRFPIFFSEKRPFFMEGLGLFSLAGSDGDGNMIAGVHTRRIVNPYAGAKITGSAGRFSFGTLSATDDTPEDLGNRGAAIAGNNKVFNIGRVLYSLGESNYVGGIVTDTEHAGRHNRAGGADLSYRFMKRHQFSATFLATSTGIANTASSSNGYGAQTTYSYSSRPFVFISQTEHYDKAFQMDTAFYNRTGFTSNWTYAEKSSYPKNDKVLRRYTFFYWNKAGQDEIQKGNERFHLFGYKMNLTRQGNFRIDWGTGREPWLGRQFKTDRLHLNGGVQLMKWLGVNSNFNRGYATYYDPVSPFQGKQTALWLNVNLQPNTKINESIGFNTVRFKRADTGAPVYDVNIVNLRSTYQFNKHFFVRAIGQYDSSRKRVLTDFLASYELVPGSVMHAGYGSLIERRGIEYMTVSRGLFFKASYLHRF